MYQIGEIIIYGSNGACRVEKVGSVEMEGLPKEKIYYTLKPVYANGGTVFTPVDNQKVKMRPVLTAKEADELIKRIREIDILWVKDEKNREQIYKDAIRTCDCEDLIKIIKTLYLRKKARLKAGKKVTSSDAKYLHLAEESLYGELSVVMGIPKNEMEAFIYDKVKED